MELYKKEEKEVPQTGRINRALNVGFLNRYYGYWPLHTFDSTALRICPPALRPPPNDQRKMNPKTRIIKLNQIVDPSWLHVIDPSLRSPFSHASHTSRKRFGWSVMTPSTPLLILHRMKYSSFTVHTYSGLCFSLIALRSREPRGPKSDFCSMLKDTWGTCKNCLAYGTEKEIFDIG